MRMILQKTAKKSVQLTSRIAMSKKINIRVSKHTNIHFIDIGDTRYNNRTLP